MYVKSESIVNENGTITYFIKNEKLSLEKMQKMVGGEYLELVYNDGETQIVCNELGKMLNYKVNEEATNIWYKNLGRNPNDFLVGNVLILKGKARMK